MDNKFGFIIAMKKPKVLYYIFDFIKTETTEIYYVNISFFKTMKKPKVLNYIFGFSKL